MYQRTAVAAFIKQDRLKDKATPLRRKVLEMPYTPASGISCSAEAHLAVD